MNDETKTFQEIIDMNRTSTIEFSECGGKVKVIGESGAEKAYILQYRKGETFDTAEDLFNSWNEVENNGLEERKLLFLSEMWDLVKKHNVSYGYKNVQNDEIQMRVVFPELDGEHIAGAKSND